MLSRKLHSVLIIFAIIALFASACSPKQNTDVEKTPKYVFFFIGDGMALPHIALTEQIYGDLVFDDFKVTGISTTFAENRYITGSAAAGTALATGHKTTIGTISKSGDYSKNYKSMAKMAKDKGKRVGIISSVSIDHATPAVFYANEDKRGNYYNIARQMATSEFDYFAGGYARGNLVEDSKGDIIDIMKEAGYTITTTSVELDKVQSGTKCWAYTSYDSEGAMHYEIDDYPEQISLADFTRKGIDLLDNEKGFFMMVEGGKIDWAAHGNDAVTVAREVYEFNNALAVALDFYHQHPDETLIVVTADHETGGLALGTTYKKYESDFDVLKYQTISFEMFNQKIHQWKEKGDVTFEMSLDSIQKYFGLGNIEKNPNLELNKNDIARIKKGYEYYFSSDYSDDNKELKSKYYGKNPFTVEILHVLSNKAGVDWTSFSHTGLPVQVFAIGQGQAEFTGYYDNTDIAKKIINIANCK